MTTLSLRLAVCCPMNTVQYVKVDTIAHTGHVSCTECISDRILVSPDGFKSPCPPVERSFISVGPCLAYLILTKCYMVVQRSQRSVSLATTCGFIQLFIASVCALSNTINLCFLAYAASFLTALQIRRLRN